MKSWFLNVISGLTVKFYYLLVVYIVKIHRWQNAFCNVITAAQVSPTFVGPDILQEKKER